MKNLKKLLGLMVVPTLALVGMANVNAASTCLDSGDKVVARYGGTDYCAKDVTTAISKAEAAEATELTVTFLDDVTESASDVELTTLKSVTIKLSGFDWALGAQKIAVASGQTVEIQGKGDVSSSATNMVELGVGGTFKTTGVLDIGADTFVQITGSETGSKVATLDIGKDTNVTASTNGVVTATSSNNIKATINGTWVTANEAVKIADGENVSGKIASVTINGTLTSKTSTAISLSGYVNVEMNATVTGADTSNAGALYIVSNGANVNITGGKYVATSGDTGTSAIIINAAAKETVLKISCGEFQASKSTVAAISFGDDETVKHNAGNITGGTFKYGLTDKTSDLTVEEAIKLLTGGVNYTTGEDKTVTIACNSKPSTGTPSDTPSEKDPGTQAGPGDDEPSKSPATFDAIGSLVTMAISSLGVVGTATKKLFR